MIAVLLYVAAILAVAFFVSGVLPGYFAVRSRRRRVVEFQDKYSQWSDAYGSMIDYNGWMGHAVPDDVAAASNDAEVKAAKLRPWLVARRDEMQRDAQAAGRGVVHIAPPPAVGGGPYMRHFYFSDLFDDQTDADAMGGPSFKLDELATILHETDQQKRRHLLDILNPWAWLRLTFERIIRFPRYVMKRAGFSAKATDSTGARVVSVAWSFVVGATTIGAFVVGLIALLQT